MLRVMQRMMFDARPRQTLFEAFLDAAALHGRSTRIIEDAQGRALLPRHRESESCAWPARLR